MKATVYHESQRNVEKYSSVPLSLLLTAEEVGKVRTGELKAFMQVRDTNCRVAVLLTQSIYSDAKIFLVEKTIHHLQSLWLELNQEDITKKRYDVIYPTIEKYIMEMWDTICRIDGREREIWTFSLSPEGMVSVQGTRTPYGSCYELEYGFPISLLWADDPEKYIQEKYELAKFQAKTNQVALKQRVIEKLATHFTPDELKFVEIRES